jgi:hypothetical protein
MYMVPWVFPSRLCLHHAYSIVISTLTVEHRTDPTSVFFICFRECLETSIIVSVLLAFLKQTLGPEYDAAVRKRLVRQVCILSHFTLPPPSSPSSSNTHV